MGVLISVYIVYLVYIVIIVILWLACVLVSVLISVLHILINPIVYNGWECPLVYVLNMLFICFDILQDSLTSVIILVHSSPAALINSYNTNHLQQ